MQKTPKLGLLVAAIILAFVLSALSALLFYTPDIQVSQFWQDGYYQHVTKFSFYQAFLSMLLSVGLAIPGAHSLSRRCFIGKSLLLKIFSISTLVCFG